MLNWMSTIRYPSIVLKAEIMLIVKNPIAVGSDSFPPSSHLHLTSAFMTGSKHLSIAILLMHMCEAKICRRRNIFFKSHYPYANLGEEGKGAVKCLFVLPQIFQYKYSTKSLKIIPPFFKLVSPDPKNWKNVIPQHIVGILKLFKAFLAYWCNIPNK